MLNTSFKINIFLILIVTSTFSCKKKKEENIIASIDDTPIYTHQLDALIQNQLYESLFGIYYKRKIALDEFIADQLINKEIQRRRINKDSLLKTEIESQINENSISQFIKDNRLENGIIDKNNPTKIISINSNEGKEALLNALKKKLTENWITLLREKYHVTTNLPLPLSPRLSLTGLKKHSRGNLNSPIEFVILSDFECSSCQQYHVLFNEIYIKYKDKVKFSYAHLSNKISLPIVVSECSTNENDFWLLHDFIFNNSPKDTSEYLTYIKSSGLKHIDLNDCLNDSVKTKLIIDGNFEISNKLGIFTTPTILIDNRVYYGELNKKNLEEYIESVFFNLDQ